MCSPFIPGTQMRLVTSPDVEVLASATTTLVVNKQPVATTVNHNGQVITLAHHEVRVLG